MNIGVHKFFWIGGLGFLGYIPSSGITGSKDSSSFNWDHQGCGATGTLTHCWWKRNRSFLKTERTPLLWFSNYKSRSFSKGSKTYIYKKTCVRMFPTILFTIAENWIQPGWPRAGDQLYETVKWSHDGVVVSTTKGRSAVTHITKPQKLCCLKDIFPNRVLFDSLWNSTIGKTKL